MQTCKLKKAVAQARRIARRHTAIQRRNLRIVRANVKPVVKRKLALRLVEADESSEPMECRNIM